MENTRIEAMLKDEFARQGIRFEMQKPVGFCRPDFYLPDFNAFVFADGCYWHGCPLHRPNMKKRRTNDAQNNAFLINRGFRVYRFWEHEILQSPFKCVNLILRDKVNLAPLQPIEVFDKLQAEKLKVPEMYGFCECGCGKRVAKPENHFLLGHSKKRNGFHHRKHQFSSSALEKIANLQRGKSLGEEMKRKIAQGIQNYWQTKRDVSLLFVDFRTEDNFQNGSKIMVDL
jgi:DNA mismatch endonuclease Vsr